jgi:Predicted transcriptional regulators
MEATDLYKCFSDAQRLRIVNLLAEGPLCVCHLQELIDAPQVKMSKQLAYLKQHGFVEATREGTWMIHRLSGQGEALIRTNLNHLRSADCAECNALQKDLRARERLLGKISRSGCPQGVSRAIA